MKKTLITLLAGLLAWTSSGCGDSNNFVSPIAPAQAQATTFTQVEFLARPGIGEALLLSNSNLNTYNAVGPSFIAAALADPNSAEGQAAAPVLAEATTVLNVLTNVNPTGITTAQAVAIFLPDVMRVDTTQTFTSAQTAYSGAANANGVLTGGRKLTDDVVDITLQVLLDDPAASDGVPYYRGASTNTNIGHARLNGQTTDFGAATFPFLAPPN